jgi:hypothetical protein
MRIVSCTGGRLELNFMWMPVFVSQNFQVMRELEKEWAKNFKGVPITEMTLDEINDWTISWIAGRFSMRCLIGVLNALKDVKEDDDGVYDECRERVLLVAEEGVC